MKKIALMLTDPHLSKSNIGLIKRIFKEADQYCADHDIPFIFILGDLLESRKAQPQQVLNTLGDILGEMTTPLYIIPGNHDKVDYESERSYLDEFLYHPGVHIIQLYEKIVAGMLDIHFIPYFKEDTAYPPLLDEVISGLDPKQRNILLTHIAVDGVVNNDGEIVKNELAGNRFKKFYAVYVGHYHNRAVVGQNVYYLGSTHQKNFGEDERKGFAVLLENGEIEYIPKQFTYYNTLKIDLDKSTKADLTQLLNDAIIEKEKPDHFIRFVFSGSSDKLAALDRNKFKSVGIDIKTESPELQREVESAKNKEFIKFDAKNIPSEFEAFCEKEGLKTEVGMVYLTRHLNNKKIGNHGDE